MLIDIMKHDRTEEREDRNGRLRARRVVTWVVQDLDSTDYLGEFATRKAAREFAARLRSEKNS